MNKLQKAFRENSSQRQLLMSSNFRIISDFSISDKHIIVPIDILPKEKLKLIHIAAFFNSTECFLYLLEQGFTLTDKSVNNFEPLHYACEGGAIEVVSYILCSKPELVNYNETDEVYKIPFYLAIYSKSPNILKIFFDYGFEFKKGHIGAFAIQAIKSESIECLILILQHEDIFRTNSLQLTPLMRAVINNLAIAIDPLIDHGANPYVYSETGETALSIACKFQNIDCVKALLKRMDYVDIPINSSHFPTAIHWACQSKCPEIAQMILDKECELYFVDKFNKMGPDYLVDIPTDKVIQILEILINHGYDLNIRGDSMHSLLYNFSFGAVRCDEKIIKFLVDHGAVINSKCENKATFFEGKKRENIVNIIRKYVKFDEDVNSEIK